MSSCQLPYNRDLAADIKSAASGGFTVFTKIVIIVITVFVVCITGTNIAAYIYILKKPVEERDVSTVWCATLITLNGLLMLACFAVLVIIIISFFNKGKKINELTSKIQLTKLAEVNAAYVAVSNNAESIGSALAADMAATARADAKYTVLKEVNKLSDADARVESKKEYDKDFAEAEQKFSTEYRNRMILNSAKNGIAFQTSGNTVDALNTFLTDRPLKCANGSNPPCGRLQDYKANLYYDYYKVKDRIGMNNLPVDDIAASAFNSSLDSMMGSGPAVSAEDVFGLTTQSVPQVEMSGSDVDLLGMGSMVPTGRIGFTQQELNAMGASEAVPERQLPLARRARFPGLEDELD